MIAVAINIGSITALTSFVKRIGEKVNVDTERDNETQKPRAPKAIPL